LVFSIYIIAIKWNCAQKFYLEIIYLCKNFLFIMTKSGRIELMAPAGDFTSLQAAIENGADSVYFGVEQLNMRARASMNFTIDDLPEIAKRCKEKEVRTYLTLNTIIYDHDLSLIKTLLDKAKDADLTAVIAMDQAVIAYARQIGMEVHISTQINITNIETVKFYALFADTMVMSRELSISQIKKICQQIEKEQVKGPSGNLVEIEIFGHGALCMAVSGKCYLSLHSHNSSANRGACKQNCRKKYTVIDQETGFEIELDNEYMLSPKDLCTIGFLDQIADAGVKVLKIEGRGRAPEYVAKVTKSYREAIDSVAEGTFNQEKVAIWMSELEKVYNRGFWDGYYLGQELGEWSSNSGSSATQKKIYIGKGRHFYPKSNIAEFLIEAYDVSVGDTILIQGPTTGSQEMVIDAMMVDQKGEAEKATKSDVITFKTDFRVRPSDKLYKVVQSETV
jgi:putative protease